MGTTRGTMPAEPTSRIPTAGASPRAPSCRRKRRTPRSPTPSRPPRGGAAALEAAPGADRPGREEERRPAAGGDGLVPVAVDDASTGPSRRASARVEPGPVAHGRARRRPTGDHRGVDQARAGARGSGRCGGRPPPRRATSGSRRPPRRSWSPRTATTGATALQVLEHRRARSGRRRAGSGRSPSSASSTPAGSASRNSPTWRVGDDADPRGAGGAAQPGVAAGRLRRARQAEATSRLDQLGVGDAGGLHQPRVDAGGGEPGHGVELGQQHLAVLGRRRSRPGRGRRSRRPRRRAAPARGRARPRARAGRPAPARASAPARTWSRSRTTRRRR